MKNVFINLFQPVFVFTTGYEFSQLYLFSKFKVAQDIGKYLIRLVYYTSIAEVSLTLMELAFIKNGSKTATILFTALFYLLKSFVKRKH